MYVNLVRVGKFSTIEHTITYARSGTLYSVNFIETYSEVIYVYEQKCYYIYYILASVVCIIIYICYILVSIIIFSERRAYVY